MKCKHEWVFDCNTGMRLFYHCKFCLRRSIYDFKEANHWSFIDGPFKENK